MKKMETVSKIDIIIYEHSKQFVHEIYKAIVLENIHKMKMR